MARSTVARTRKKHQRPDTPCALPRPPAALGRARPSCSSSPAPLTPPPRPPPSCAATAAPPSAAAVNEDVDFSKNYSCTGRIHEEPPPRCTPHIPTSAPRQRHHVVVACAGGDSSGVLDARSRAERQLSCEVVGSAGGRCGHGRCRHDDRAQPSAAGAMPRSVDRERRHRTVPKAWAGRQPFVGFVRVCNSRYRNDIRDMYTGLLRVLGWSTSTLGRAASATVIERSASKGLRKS